MVLIHRGLHDHTRGINAFAYGEFHFSYTHQQRCSIDSTLPALSSDSTLWKQVVRSFYGFIHFSFLPCISHHLFTLASAAKDILQQGIRFPFYFSMAAKQLHLLVFSKNSADQAGGGFQCGTGGSNVD